MKYPNIIFCRNIEYNNIDIFFDKNCDKLLCSINIINNDDNITNQLNKLFHCNYQLLVTYGNNTKESYDIINKTITNKIRNRWLHFDTIDDIDIFNRAVNYCYIDNVVKNQEDTRPTFSLFTTCYNTYDKINRVYSSIKKQNMNDWEWVILDDSPDDEHFKFLKNYFKDDKKIRLFKKSENSGNIGEVKNEAVSLCRGKYVLEMDHDDEILPDTLLDASNVFDSDEEIGFIYMDYANVYEDWQKFTYGNFFSLGYSGYYKQKYNNNWVYVAMTPNINNVTLSHIVSVPNHPRIWRKDTLLKIGNYSEFLPVLDDYELLLRTSVHTKIAKINKLGYIQYMNYDNNNFSLIRNSEINRLVYPLKDICFDKYNIDEVMKNKNAFIYDNDYSKQIWKRENFEYKYCNKIINLNYKKQYCIIGLETIIKFNSQIRDLYNDETNDFIVLDNTFSSDDDKICNVLDELKLEKMKCYSMNDCTDEELIVYFHLIYKSCSCYSIIKRMDDNYFT